MLDSFRFDEQKKLLNKKFSSSEANLDYEFRFSKTCVDKVFDEFKKLNFRYDSYLLTKEEQA